MSTLFLLVLEEFVKKAIEKVSFSETNVQGDLSKLPLKEWSLTCPAALRQTGP